MQPENGQRQNSVSQSEGPRPDRQAMLPARSIAMLGLILFVVITGAILLVTQIAPSPESGTLSGHGWTAMILGAVLTLAIGIALMGLVFFSSRRGYDDEIGRNDR